MSRDSRGRFVKKGQVVADFSAFEKLVTKLSGDQYVKVGVVGAAGDEKKDRAMTFDRGERVGVIQESGATVADIAMIHEYGAPAANIPERSFIRSTLHEKERELGGFVAKLCEKEIQGLLSRERSLELLGAWAAGEIKKKVARGPHIPPPLKEATKERKGSDRPLVDTGQLVGSINFEVVK